MYKYTRFGDVLWRNWAKSNPSATFVEPMLTQKKLREPKFVCLADVRIYIFCNFTKNLILLDMNEYIKRINALVSKIPVEFIDFTKPREKASLPNQAQSNFITNREQGDWAENLVMTTINEQSKNYIAVKYGKSDDTVAGEDGFKEFYETYQQELDTIGKRPDLLIFRKEDYDITFGTDISKIDHIKINDYVKRAVAGI